MWFKIKRNSKQCDAAQEALRLCSESGQDFVSAGTLIAQLPAAMSAHVNSCADCAAFASELCDVRELFSEVATSNELRCQPSPYFLAKVMAAISERERELEAGAQTWAAVPRLAHRVSALASITLLIAGSWLYQQPRNNPATQTIASGDQSSEGLVEGSASNIQDDFLLNPADR
jgi:hypothetical protein